MYAETVIHQHVDISPGLPKPYVPCVRASVQRLHGRSLTPFSSLYVYTHAHTPTHTASIVALFFMTYLFFTELSYSMQKVRWLCVGACFHPLTH